MTPLLELHDVHARYGPIKALHGITLTVDEGEITAILGANGAGKTTTLRAISHTVRRTGSIRFAGRPLGRGGPEAVARRGPLKEDLNRVRSYFPWIDSRAAQQAGTLSGGEQQMLALARAIMQRPQLMLLDEPSLGLAPIFVSEIFRIVKELNEKEGLTVLVVEQNANIALQAADTAYVLEVGRVALFGPSAELKEDEAVRKSYLGY